MQQEKHLGAVSQSKHIFSEFIPKQDRHLVMVSCVQIRLASHQTIPFGISSKSGLSLIFPFFSFHFPFFKL